MVILWWKCDADNLHSISKTVVLNIKFVYLFERQIRPVSQSLVHSANACSYHSWDRARARSWKLNSELPLGWQEPNYSSWPLPSICINNKLKSRDWARNQIPVLPVWRKKPELVSLFKIYFIYKGRVKERESIHWFTPIMTAVVKAGLSWNQKIKVSSGCFMWVQWPKPSSTTFQGHYQGVGSELEQCCPNWHQMGS